MIENIPEDDRYSIKVEIFDTNDERVELLSSDAIDIYTNLTSIFNREIETLKVSTPIIKAVHKDANDTLFRLDSTVEITCATDDATILYTIDGSDPKEEGQIYDPEKPITLTENCTIRAIAEKEGFYLSDEASESFTINLRKPSFTLEENTYNTNQNVKIETGDVGVSIEFSLDNNKFQAYDVTNGIAVDKTMTVYARTTYNNYVSEVAKVTYTMKVADVTFSPENTTLKQQNTEIKLSTTTSNATIYYNTINDLSLYDSSNKLNDGWKNIEDNPLTVSGPSTKIRVIATRKGWTPTEEVSKTYEIVGSSAITVEDPYYNNLTLEVPETWKGVVVPGVNATITAKLKTDSTNVQYKWYLTRDGKDPVPLDNMDTNKLYLGTDKNENVYLYPGINTIKCDAVVNGKLYSAEYRFSVSVTGVGEKGPNTDC